MHKLVPETACQLLWSPLASAFGDKVAAEASFQLFSVSASPHAHGQVKLHLLMNTPLTPPQIQQYPDCFGATGKALPSKGSVTPLRLSASPHVTIWMPVPDPAFTW